MTQDPTSAREEVMDQQIRQGVPFLGMTRFKDVRSSVD